MTMDDDFPQKRAFKYFCLDCDYYTQRKNDYDRHLSSTKHSRMTNDDINSVNAAKGNEHAFSLSIIG
jgi:hypothetical protein